MFVFAFQPGPEQNLDAGKGQSRIFASRHRAGHGECCHRAGGPFGAVIVRDGRIVGEGVNTVTAANDPTAHAEVNAIRAACKALRSFTLAGCQLYSSCEPCPMCLAAAYWAQIDDLYYGASADDAARAGFNDAFLYEELRKEPNARSIPATQLLGDEAWASFRCGSPRRTRSNTDSCS